MRIVALLGLRLPGVMSWLRSYNAYLREGVLLTASPPCVRRWLGPAVSRRLDFWATPRVQALPSDPAGYYDFQCFGCVERNNRAPCDRLFEGEEFL